MGESNTRRRKSFWRVLIFPAFVLLLVMLVLFFVNWRFVSSDIIGLRGQRAPFFSSESSDTFVPVSTKSTLRTPSTNLNPVITGTDISQVFQNPQDVIKASSMDNVQNRVENGITSYSNSKTSWKDDTTIPNDHEATRNESEVVESDSAVVHEGKISQDTQNEIVPDPSISNSASSEVQDIISDAEEETQSTSCKGTPLEEQVLRSSYLKITDFDCSESNRGWEQHIPEPISNSSRSIRMRQDRLKLLKEFSYQQDHFNYHDDVGKYIVFYPIFAGIGNNLAVFAEVLLIALRSNRKFLVYDWDALRDYFYLPFQFEVIKEKGNCIVSY